MNIKFDNLRLRANPAYRAVAWNRVKADAARTLEVDEDSFGVLMPAAADDLPIVAIDRDTALLFLSLQEPGPPPDFVFAGRAGESDRILRRLIFDAILQVEQGGEFVAGPHAFVDMALDRKYEGLAGLSFEAIRYAAALIDVDATTLAHKLYTYNRRPTTPALRRSLPDRAACLNYLGLGPEAGRSSHNARVWSRGSDDSPWLVFTRTQSRGHSSERGCKLYVGVAFEELATCLPELIEQLGRSDAQQFKIGTELDGLLRPDKLVAYFPGKDELLSAAQSLLPIVNGKKLHAVPFSAEVGGAGALSWGADPEAAWFGDRLSWRQWVCEKLAAAVISARTSAVEAENISQLALERLRLDGVDGNTFMPTSAWSGAA